MLDDTKSTEYLVVSSHDDTFLFHDYHFQRSSIWSWLSGARAEVSFLLSLTRV